MVDDGAVDVEGDDEPVARSEPFSLISTLLFQLGFFVGRALGWRAL